MTIRRLLIALLCVAAPRLAEAQFCQISGPSGNCSVNVTTSITVPVILRMVVSSGSTALSVTEADYDAGSVITGGPTVTVSANQAWRVQVSTSNTFWTATNTAPGTPARTNKPLSDFQWLGGAVVSYTAISGTGVNLNSGSATASSVSTLSFKTFWSYLTDTPGIYAMPVTITLLSP